MNSFEILHARKTGRVPSSRTSAHATALLRGIAAAAGLDPVDRKKPIMVVEELRTTD